MQKITTLAAAVCAALSLLAPSSASAGHTTLPQGKKLVAYPYGTWKKYQIKKTTSKVGSTISGYLYAFDPMGLSCEIE